MKGMQPWGVEVENAMKPRKNKQQVKEIVDSMSQTEESMSQREASNLCPSRLSKQQQRKSIFLNSEQI